MSLNDYYDLGAFSGNEMPDPLVVEGAHRIIQSWAHDHPVDKGILIQSFKTMLNFFEKKD